MRLKQKYKVLKQLKSWKAAEYYPIKLFTTNKKSWKAIVSTYNLKTQNSLIKESRFSLNSIAKTKRWDFNRKLYKNGLELKRYYYHIFDSIIRNKTLKRIYLNESKKYKENNFINNSLYLVKPNFRLDILIWLLGFANSVYQSRKLVTTKNVCVNINKNPNPNNLLNTGDIISIAYNKHLTFKEISKKKVFFKNQFAFFCEVDYYSKNVVLVSDFSNMLNSYDNPQVFFKKLDIRKFISYLKKEY